LSIDLCEAIRTEQPFGSGRPAAYTYEAIPAPHDAVASDQPLANGKRLTGIAVGYTNLGKAPLQGSWCVDMVE
jgi:hypothetical protein